MRTRTLAAALIALVGALAACADGDDGATSPTTKTDSDAAATPSHDKLDRVVKIEPGRGLYVRCTGTGSPTVVMEGGDDDTSDAYAFAEPAISKVTRTCVYDRANLGRSDPAPGPRGLAELTGDLEQLLQAAEIPGPYVLVGTSGGGYITAGYAYAHPEKVAGMVFVDVAAPFRNPPPEVVEDTDPDNPANVEKRDFLQVEKDAWKGRKRIGDMPVTIITDRPTKEAIQEETDPSWRQALRHNVADQKGWLVLSPRAKQVVVHTGHAVEEADPDLVINAILDVLKDADAQRGTTAREGRIVFRRLDRESGKVRLYSALGWISAQGDHAPG
jgi:Alpha/beta hydrolase family